MTETCSVVCVLRSGGEYAADHVRKLHESVQRWWPKDLPLRFVALTDLPIHAPGIEERPLYYRWAGWWSKMELFDAVQDDLGDVLYFDLDSVIVGSLEQVVKRRPLTLLRDFYFPDHAQSGMMFLPRADRAQVSAAFLANPASLMARFQGDGDFLDDMFRGKNVALWQEALPGSIVSYKAHVQKRAGQSIPPDARVVCFHGQPRPWATPLWGRA